MNIQEFCAHYASNPRKAAEVVREWGAEQIDSLLNTLKVQHDQAIGQA
jgi:hypothetical protein